MFNELCTYSKTPLLRMQQLVVEDLLNRHKELRSKITTLLFISNNATHRNEVSFNNTDLDETIIDFYDMVRKDRNNIKDIYDGTMYWSNSILRSDSYLTLQEHILKREIKFDNIDALVRKNMDFTYDNNNSVKYNVLQFIFKYGFASMVYLYFDDAIRYNTYRIDNAGYANSNRDYMLICLELSLQDKPVFLVKSDLYYDKQMSYILNDRDINLDYTHINLGWQEAICSLVNRHLHTDETIINTNEFLLYREWDRPNIPNDANILI
jgi:hypothetical protein